MECFPGGGNVMLSGCVSSSVGRHISKMCTDDDECSEESDNVKQVVVGICAMEKKSGSKPMKEILTRLEEFEFIRTCIFPEDVILKVSFLESDIFLLH